MIDASEIEARIRRDLRAEFSVALKEAITQAVEVLRCEMRQARRIGDHIAKLSEVAPVLGYSVAHANQLLLGGKFPVTPINPNKTKHAHWRFRWSEVETYLLHKNA